MPWYDHGGVTIHVGHVLDVLAQLPAESVQCVVTSPPYWGLRAYGTDPQVWGGDPACSHTLEETPAGKVLTGGTGTASAKQVSNAGSQYGNAWVAQERVCTSLPGSEKQASNYGANGVVAVSATCTRCGAWRGELGSEPTPEQFVANLVTVFRAVRRVLRDDGTLWLNLGDSYAGSGKGPTGATSMLNGGAGVGPGEKVARRTYEVRQGFVDPGAIVPPGLKSKDLVGIPWRVAFALQADGWYLRSDIIWSKPNPMPESVTDRPTKAHEYLFLLSKRADYYYDGDAVREAYKPESLGRYAYSLDGTAPTARQPDNGDVDRRKREAGVRDPNPAGRNRRSVWTIPTESYEGAHFATFPRRLVEPCVLAGTSARGQCPRCGAPWRRVVAREQVADPGRSNGAKYLAHGDRNDGARRLGGQYQAQLDANPPQTTGWAQSCPCPPAEPVPQVILDPFLGSGTTAYVARHHGRRAVGIELNETYAQLAADRLKQAVLPLGSILDAPPALREAWVVEVTEHGVTREEGPFETITDAQAARAVLAAEQQELGL